MMASKLLNLSVTTYNCKGFDERKVTFIKDLFNKCDFLLLQEHWLYKSMFHELCRIDKNASFCATSSMNESVILQGRRHGGCAIIWRSNLSYKVKSIDCNNVRVCGVLIHLEDNCTLLLFTVYMPCDVNGAHLDEYNAVLDAISCCVCKYDPTYYIISGDFNTDFNRRSSQTLALKAFLRAEDCSAVDNGVIEYTYTTADGMHTSLIDHFVVCNSLKEKVASHSSYDHVDNMSDHVSVNCCIDIPGQYMDTGQNDCVNTYCQWDKASEMCVQN